MAKFSMNAAFLLLAVFAFVAHGHIQAESGGALAKGGSSGGKDASSGGSSGGEGAGGASGGSEGGNKIGEMLSKGGLGSLMNGGSGGSKEEGGNVDPATKFKNVLNKFLLVLQSYTSKELGPELKNAAIKLIQFVLHYWAQQKPEEMQKFNNFLETSAKATSGALSKASSGGGSSSSSSSSSGSSGGSSQA